MNRLLLLLPFIWGLAIKPLSNEKSEGPLSPSSLPAVDTIVFAMRSDFNGDCEKKCYVFLGSNRINTINQQPVGNSCTHLFIQCPSAVRLNAGKTYRFIACPFRPNKCSTIIDTCSKNLFYELIREIP